jgi:hypothetical protein
VGQRDTRDEMMPPVEPTPEDLLKLDIDLRIGVEAWALLWDVDDSSDEQLAAVLRFAYGQGYLQALSELEWGKLCRDYGFAVPRRRHPG